MAKFYVTTAIPYVNASPHIGFTMEILQADVLARYHRQKGDETYFLTGTDEHGTKLFNMAKKENTTPIAIADKYAETFKSLTRNFNITNDDFIRTTEERHIRGAQKLWKILADKGDIYKAKYSGLYCSGCEAYVLEKDLVEGK
ncbi:MAG: class I tRNA ligase family protein, partial [Candidatus Gracilibacteria bacterium]